MRNLIRFIPAQILFIILFLLPLNADVLTDIKGTYFDLGKNGSAYGGGLSLLWDLPRFFDKDKVLFYLNTSYAYGKKSNDQGTENKYIYAPVSAGFEYRYQMYNIPLYITGSAGGGVSYFRKENPAVLSPSKTEIESAFGPYADFMIGLNYVLTQKAALFTEAGYHSSFYHNDNIDSPSGLMFSIGIRIPISGNFRNFD